MHFELIFFKVFLNNSNILILKKKINIFLIKKIFYKNILHRINNCTLIVWAGCVTLSVGPE
jgi:hypothetical protein